MITEDDLYCMAMESQHAWHKMEELCKALGFPFPPEQQNKKGSSAPVTLAFNSEI